MQNTNINLIPTTFEEVKASIIKKFRDDPTSPFKDYDFAGSALNYLIDIISYATMYNNYYASVITNELFLPHAKLSKNILSLAQSLGYKPRRKTSSSAYVRISAPTIADADKSELIRIPIYSKLKSRKGLPYILTEEIILKYNYATNNWEPVRNNAFAPDNSPFLFRLKQGQYQSLIYTPNSTTGQFFFIDKTNIENSKESIIIQDKTAYEIWHPFYDMSDLELDSGSADVINANTTVDQLKNELIINNQWENYILNLTTSAIFFIDNMDTGVRIGFGDGVLGKIPTNPLDVMYFLTDGIKGNGDSIFNFEGIVYYKKTDSSIGKINSNKFLLAIDDGTSAVGGAEVESEDSIKKLAPSFYNTQNRAVLTNDYETYLIQQQSVPLKNIKCIGGENLKPPIMASVGICANKITETDTNIRNSLLTDTEKSLIKLMLKNQNVATINPTFINPEFVKINMDSTLFYNPLAYDQNKVFLASKYAILLYFNALNGFKKYFKYSHLLSSIDLLEEVNHNLMTISLEYIKLIEKKDLEKNLNINLGINNPITPGSIDKIQTADYFLKLFNKDTYYEWSQYDAITNPTGVFVAPVGISNWDITTSSPFYKDTVGTTLRSKIHKIFLYDLVEEVGETTGRLFLVEKTPLRLKAERVAGGNNFPFKFTYENIIETGKRKLIGEISYNEGLINLFMDNMSFKYKDENKISRQLAVQSTDNTSDGYTTIDDMFLYTYDFDIVSNLPWNNTSNPAIWVSNDRTEVQDFLFNIAFATDREDFESMGNILITQGSWTYQLVEEVNK